MKKWPDAQCFQKQAAFSMDDNHATRVQDVLLSNNGDLNYCWLPRKLCDDLAKWQGNVSELSELIDTMEHNTMNTTECIPKEDSKILKRSQPEENQMHNGENEICNDPRKRRGNVSEQSEPIDTMEHNNAMKTTECIHKEDTTTLKRSQPEDNQKHNGENGVSDVTDIRHDESRKSDCETVVIYRNSATPCREDSVRRCKTPICITKE